MSAPPTYSTEEERREAASLAGEPSDEELEASLREEAHHHRPTVYVPSEKAGETRPAHAKGGEKGGDEGGAPSKSSHQKHHQKHSGDTAADVAQHDRELYGVRDTTKLDSVCRLRREAWSPSR